MVTWWWPRASATTGAGVSRRCWRIAAARPGVVWMPRALIWISSETEPVSAAMSRCRGWRPGRAGHRSPGRPGAVGVTAPGLKIGYGQVSTRNPAAQHNVLTGLVMFLIKIRSEERLMTAARQLAAADESGPSQWTPVGTAASRADGGRGTGGSSPASGVAWPRSTGHCGRAAGPSWIGHPSAGRWAGVVDRRRWPPRRSPGAAAATHPTLRTVRVSRRSAAVVRCGCSCHRWSR